jgi:hypothetical protein
VERPVIVVVRERETIVRITGAAGPS